MKLKTLEIFENEMSATVFQHVLENEGIQSRVFKNHTFRFRFVNDDEKIGFELQVHEKDFEAANSILTFKKNH